MPTTTKSVSLDKEPSVTIHKQEPPKPEVEPTVDMTAEELSKLAVDATTALFGTSAKPPPAKNADEPPKEPEKKEPPKEEPKAEAPKEEPKAPAKEEPKPEPKEPKAAKPVPPTADEIADKVTERLKTQQPPPAPQPDPEPQAPKLSKEDQFRRDVFEQMAQSNEEYKGLPEKFDKFLAQERSYREAWEKANPGKTFNPDDEDHSEFYDANEPTFNTDDYLDSRIQLQADRIADEKIQKRERERAEKEARETVNKRLASMDKEITAELATALDPELAKIDADKLKTEDPLASKAMKPYLPELSALCGELVKIFTPGLGVTPSRENPLHVHLWNRTLAYEQELLTGPEKDRALPDGRKLVAMEDFNRMSPEQKAKHWTIWAEPNVVRARLVNDYAAVARQDLSEMREFVAKKTARSAPPPPPKPEPKAEPTPAPEKAPTVFPNTHSGAENVPTEKNDSLADPSTAKLFSKILFS